MPNLWKFLNSPELVFKIQASLGVERLDKDDENKKFRIRNKFFYYLFLIGTELGECFNYIPLYPYYWMFLMATGDELFYGIFIPVFFFNIDAFIGRRFVFHWFVNMYVGGALKQMFKEERPKAPAIQMQEKYSNEYSLPSTHAMGAFPIAASIIYFAIDR